LNFCVFGASSNDIDYKYIVAGEELGREMAKRGHTLVFGGGKTGLMGAAARGIKEKSGKMIGIAPRFFDMPGVLCEDCTEFIYTDTMRQRKELMENKSDGFIVTPGGIGTFEEFFEIYTLKQLGQHSKPIGFLNTDGYYDDLMGVLKTIVEKGFMKEECLQMFYIEEDVKHLMDMMESK